MESKKNYRLGLHGCDDSTKFNIELTDTEFKLIARISYESARVSTYGCMPTLRIVEVDDTIEAKLRIREQN